MTKNLIIERAVRAINELPQDKAEEISSFIEFIFSRYEEMRLKEGIQRLTSQGQAFDFLNDEEDLYSLADVKEAYNG